MKTTFLATAIVLTNIFGTAAFATTRQVPNEPLNSDAQTENDTQPVKELRAGKAMPLLFQNGKATTVLSGYVQKN